MDPNCFAKAKLLKKLFQSENKSSYKQLCQLADVCKHLNFLALEQLPMNNH